MKKGIFLLSLIILLSAGWSGLWYFISGKVEATITETKTRLAEKGRKIDCTNQEIHGYPFRIGLNCDAVRYSDDVTGLELKTGKLKTAAQAYQPNKAVIEVKSPASLKLPNGDLFNTTWSSMRSSVKAGLAGPETLSLHGKEVTLISTSSEAQTIRFKDIQFHGRQIGDNNINLAINLDDATSQSTLWPAFNLKTAVLLENAYKDIINRTSLLRVAREKGLKGQIERFQYAPINGGLLEITGPVEISSQGLLSGKFNVTVRDLPELLDALGKSFPTEKQKLSDASSAISLLSQSTGRNELTLPIRIRNGSMSIGIIPLGKLDPLF